MNRNVESRFAQNAVDVNISRSKFKRGQEVKLTGNIGDIIPIYIDEVLPGDTHSITTSKVVRLQTPLTPFMDNIYADTYYFFIPNRLVWEHWENFCGQNDDGPWITDQTEYTIPQISAPASTGWNVGTIADYLGIPTGVTGFTVSALPFRAYARVCEEWFRNENLSQPLLINYDETTQTGSNGNTFVSDVANGGKPYTATKYHDYFTSCLPAPQKHDDVGVSLGTFSTNGAVYGNGAALGVFGFDANNSNVPLTGALVNYADTLKVRTDKLGVNVPKTSAEGWSSGSKTLTGGVGLGIITKEQAGEHPEYTGLTTDITISGQTLFTINQLREAFQIQKYYEKLARGGSRYTEYLTAMFGVTSPDYRLQRTEYLGGVRQRIVVNQVLQTSGTITDSSTNAVSSTPQGTTTAYSLTTDTHNDFTKSFTEHGFILGVMVLRYDHTYQQGIERMWSRSDILDYYVPVFANLGEQAVKNKEIYLQNDSVVDSDGKVINNKTFGYQEAWAEYRYKPNRVAGEMRSTYATSLDMWHLGDDYNALPSLGDSWIREDKSNVDRVLAVTSSVSNQFLADIYIDNTSVRPMPLFSVPGLIDHH